MKIKEHMYKADKTVGTLNPVRDKIEGMYRGGGGEKGRHERPRLEQKPAEG